MQKTDSGQGYSHLSAREKAPYLPRHVDSLAEQATRYYTLALGITAALLLLALAFIFRAVQTHYQDASLDAGDGRFGIGKKDPGEGGDPRP